MEDKKEKNKNLLILGEFVKHSGGNQKSLGDLVSALTMTISAESAKEVIESYDLKKMEFFERKSQEPEEDEIFVLCLLCSNLSRREDLKTSIENLEMKSIESFFFGIEFFVDNLEKMRILTQTMVSERSFSEASKQVIMTRIMTYISGEKFRIGLCKQIFENMNEINLAGSSKTESMEKVSGFVDNLFFLTKKINFGDNEIQLLLEAIAKNFDSDVWRNLEVESEKFGIIKVFSLWEKEAQLVAICLEEIIGILIQFYLRALAGRENLHEESSKILRKILLEFLKNFSFETDFPLFSEENSIKLILIIFDFLKSDEEKIKFVKEIESLSCFRTIIKSNVHSMNSEKRKLSFIFFNKFSELLQDKQYKYFMKGCNNLSTTLDSYGIHLISDQWNSTIDELLNYIITSKGEFEYKSNPFFYFQMLIQKALTHVNSTVQSFCVEYLFAQNLQLPLFNELLLETLIENLNNYRLYDDIGDDADIESEMEQKLRNFFTRNLGGNPEKSVIDTNPELVSAREELKKIIPDYVDRTLKFINRFNSVPTVWSFFDIAYTSGIRDVELNEDHLQKLEECLKYFKSHFKEYPPYRKNLLLRSIVSFFGVLKRDEATVELWMNYLSGDNEMKALNQNLAVDVQSRFLDVFNKGRESIIEQEIINFEENLEVLVSEKEVESMMMKIVAWDEYNARGNEEYSFRSFEVFRRMVNEILPEQVKKNYKEEEVFKNFLIPNYCTFVKYSFEAGQISKYEGEKLSLSQMIELNLEVLLVCDEVNYNYIDNLEEIGAIILRKIHVFEKEEDIEEKLLKMILKISSHLNFLVEGIEENPSKVINICLISLALIQLIAFASKLKVLNTNNESLGESIRVVYSTLRKMKRMKSKELQIYKFYLEDILELTFHQILGLEQDYMHDKIGESSLISHVRENSKEVLEVIFDCYLFPVLQKNHDLFSKFYAHFINSLKLLKNTPKSQFLFKTFLYKNFEDVDESSIKLFSIVMKDTIEVENNAFMHRQTTLLVCRLLSTLSPKLLHMIDLLSYLVTKKEIRPRDSSFMVDISEFARLTYLGENAQEIELRTNSFDSFPRIVVLITLEGVMKAINHPENQLKPEKIEILEFLLEKIILIIVPKFMKNIKRKAFRPFDAKHRHALCTWQFLIIIAEYLKTKPIEAEETSPTVKRMKGYFLDIFENVIKMPLQSYTRHYAELTYILMFFNDSNVFDSLLEETLSKGKLKINPTMSLIYIICFRLLFAELPQKSFLKNFETVSLNIACNTSYIRSVTQYFMIALINAGKLDEILQEKPRVFLENKIKENINLGFIEDCELSDLIETVKKSKISVENLSKKENMNLLNSRVHLVIEMIARNKDNAILLTLFDAILKKYNNFFKNASVMNLLQTRYKDETQEICHAYLGLEMKKMQNLIMSFHKDSSLVKPFEENWLEELKEVLGENPDEAEAESHEIFQRKIDSLLMLQNVEQVKERKSKMCVVASLVSKLPNLANLTRTCEVLGMDSLVIPNRRILKNRQYLNVTVTAEKWIPIIECNEENLPSFLQMKRENGYKIVALEQTSQSTPLSSFKWPEKCVLLLGKEKEGVPHNLLQFVDVCVEIEQFGKIRSLNVHISAVLSIWEFVKQKYISSSTEQ